MFTLRAAENRGSTNLGWLDSKHTFSFNTYYDPENMGFRSLRVINDDIVMPGKGFGTHPHRDMEIISFVVRGALEHKDSMGTGSIIEAGEIQKMTAGTGVMHSEFNASSEEEVRFLQIWMTPSEKNLRPEYEQLRIADKTNQWQLVASGNKAGGLKIYQDADIFAARLQAGVSLTHLFDKGRAGWLQVVNGSMGVGSQNMHAGDGLAIENEARINIIANKDSELLLFDLN